MPRAIALLLLALFACSGAIVVVSVGTCPDERRLEQSKKPDASSAESLICPDAGALVWFCE